MKRGNVGPVIGAFVGGAIVGGVLALLFAPRSGAETRGMIRDYIDDEVDLLRDKVAAARDLVEGAKECAAAGKKKAKKPL